MRGPADVEDEYWDDDEVDIGRPTEFARPAVGDEDYWLALDDEDDIVD